jgi:hypothetical protein
MKTNRITPLLWIALLALAACGQPASQTPKLEPSGVSAQALGCTNTDLITAITDANTDPGPTTIDLNGGCTYTLTDVNNVSASGPNGLPIITSEIVINGNGATIKRDSTSQFRIFEVASGAKLTFNNLTITGGETRNAAGIFNYGTLTLNSSTVSGNSATNGAGGGVFNNGNLTLNSSTVSGNSATIGGGIVNNRNLTLENSTVSGNSATNNGGGIYIANGIIALNNSTVSGNSATNGIGGGIYNDGTLTLNNITVSGNSAGGSGGGIYNESGKLTLKNSIIANSTAGGDCRIVSGGRTDEGYNFIEDSSNTCGLTNGTNGNIVGVDPNLGPLQNNGGPTFTHALLSVSGSPNPAQDKIPPANCGTATDQRGVSRPQGGNCDIGAFELEVVSDTTPPTLNPVVTPNPVLLGGSATVAASASDSGSGIASQSCGSLNTSSVGSKTVSCTATDNAGNTASKTASYQVIYNFVGFSQPVDNNVLNTAKAGQAIPLKWRLLDAGGAAVSNLASVQVTVITLSCSTGTTADAIEEYATGNSGLRNLGNGYYQFNWNTPKSYAGSCKTMRLDLGEGSFRSANFQFR